MGWLAAANRSYIETVSRQFQVGLTRQTHSCDEESMHCVGNQI